ncbi:restriction endonuclease subunit S [Arthrobacter sp.]|uniref:restriction endonuclease subunit S n=1 Tax=Arthrobacter sp. TaxID=1667 RepID=UPI0026DEDBFC|nr:restriction endonuclease subunit S [Arthrobacter sp.]MDO5753316.1 restriction endonuclease subunit S [Arthrobacter sp.]
MSEWPSFPLVDLVHDRQISYGVVQPGNDSETGVPIVRVKDVRNGVVDESSPMRVDEEIIAKHSRTTLAGGELLLSLVGTVGESAVAQDSLRGWNVARAIAVIRPVDVSSRWLQLCFESAPIKSEILGVLNTTVQSTLNLADLKRLQIPVPPANIRSGIEEVLGALDDKIAANTKFVDTTFALAGAHFQRLMAHSREMARLGDLISLDYGKSLSTTSRVPGPVNVYGSGGITGTHTTALCSEPGVIVGGKGTAGAVHWSHGPYFPIDTTYYVSPKSPEISQVFCYFLLRTLRLDSMNNDSAVPGLNRNEAHAIPVRVPSKASTIDFTETATTLFESAAAIEAEIRKLAATRDALLPQLMSGKLRVKDAEILVSVAV